MLRAFLAGVCLLGLATAAAATPARPETEAEQKARMRWWTEARFGMFIHWGLYALPARHEWVRSRERLTDEAYARYFDRWAQYWHRLEQLRAAASPSSAEDQLARDMFSWQRSAPEALRQVLRSARARWRYRRLRAEWMTQPSTG